MEMERFKRMTVKPVCVYCVVAREYYLISLVCVGSVLCLSPALGSICSLGASCMCAQYELGYMRFDTYH